MSDIELKPCPFCGRSGAILDEPLNEDEYGCFCNAHCGAIGPCDEDGEKAMEFWNTRPAEDELRAEISTLQAENDMLKKTASELAKSLITLRTARAEKAEAERDTALARLADLENGRPMATAPRDGTLILVEVIRDDFVYLDLVVWHDGKCVGNADNYFELDGRWWPLPGRQE